MKVRNHLLEQEGGRAAAFAVDTVTMLFGIFLSGNLERRQRRQRHRSERASRSSAQWLSLQSGVRLDRAESAVETALRVW